MCSGTVGGSAHGSLLRHLQPKPDVSEFPTIIEDWLITDQTSPPKGSRSLRLTSRPRRSESFAAAHLLGRVTESRPHPKKQTKTNKTNKKEVPLSRERGLEATKKTLDQCVLNLFAPRIFWKESQSPAKTKNKIKSAIPAIRNQKNKQKQTTQTKQRYLSATKGV